MPISFENAFSIHDDAMVMRAKRASILASNIANADTPNYKARDVDFKQLLQSMGNHSGNKLELASTNRGHINMSVTNLSGSLETALQYRNPLHASLDGNTVDSHVEQSKFAENALLYQTSFTLLNGKVKGLMKAIKGE